MSALTKSLSDSFKPSDVELNPAHIYTPRSIHTLIKYLKYLDFSDAIFKAILGSKDALPFDDITQSSDFNSGAIANELDMLDKYCDDEISQLNINKAEQSSGIMNIFDDYFDLPIQGMDDKSYRIFLKDIILGMKGTKWNIIRALNPWLFNPAIISDYGIVKSLHNTTPNFGGFRTQVDPIYDLRYNFSVEMFVYIDATSDTQYVFKKVGGFTASYFQCYISGGTIWFAGDGGGAWTWDSGLPISTGWHFISVTHDSNNTLIVRHDYATSATRLLTIVTSDPIGSAWWFGTNSDNMNGLKGRLDELRMYDKTLSDAEIKRHYNDGKGITEVVMDNLVAAYHLDGNLNDYSKYNLSGLFPAIPSNTEYLDGIVGSKCFFELNIIDYVPSDADLIWGLFAGDGSVGAYSDGTPGYYLVDADVGRDVSGGYGSSYVIGSAGSIRGGDFLNQIIQLTKIAGVDYQLIEIGG